MILGEIDSALSILGRIKKWFGRKKKGLGDASQCLPARFYLLFENHGIHKNQIPGFFDHGLKLADVKDEGSILIKLDEEILNDACKMFAVRREWLDGADSQVYPLHDFYKKPSEFEDFICNVKKKNPEDLHAELIVSYERFQEENALLILEETIGFIGEKRIYRHHICNGWRFEYWKCRAYLTACVALSCKNRVWVKGYEVPIKEINRLKEGSQFISSDGIQHQGFSANTWYPEDMVLLPDIYLNKINPENDNFGTRAALSLWLELYGKGLMHTGYPADHPREKFSDALKLIDKQ